MLTLSRQTVTKVGTNYDDDEDMRWRGAAEKYLATVAERTYLVKPDIGWPSDRDHERVAAAYYRRMGVPVPNVVNATVGGIAACAVRILHNAHPIGDDFGNLTSSESRDVFRGLLLSSLIGDRDRHGYNWIADGTRAYAIDHGLAFAQGGIGRISGFATEYVYDMLDAGTIALDDMADIAANLPEDAARIAALAWAHVRRDGGNMPEDVRSHFAEYVEAIRADYNSGRELTYTDWFAGYAVGDPEPTEPECDCTMCRGQESEPSDMTWHTLRTIDRTAESSVIVIRKRNNICGSADPRWAIRPHAHRWSMTRGWHSSAITQRCRCAQCHRPAGRMAGKPCPSGKPFPRKVSDIRRNVWIVH